jgi:hypothetical protein
MTDPSPAEWLALAGLSALLVWVLALGWPGACYLAAEWWSQVEASSAAGNASEVVRLVGVPAGVVGILVAAFVGAWRR